MIPDEVSIGGFLKRPEYKNHWAEQLNMQYFGQHVMLAAYPDPWGSYYHLQLVLVLTVQPSIFSKGLSLGPLMLRSSQQD